MARGFVSGLAFASAAIIGVGAVDCVADETDARTAVQWIAELVLVALVAGYARRILGERELEQSIAMTRIGQLADANALLFSLHRVAQALPASLDLDEALDSTMSRLADLFDYDAAALLVLDETDGAWVCARRDGVRLPAPARPPTSCPARMQRALALRTLVYEPNLLGQRRARPRPPAARRACTPSLPARGSIIGLLAVEHGAGRPLQPTATSSCSPASSSRPPSPSTTPAGSAGCAPSAPRRSATASPATCTTASASRSPTSPSSSTAS